MLTAPQILHFRICGTHFLEELGDETGDAWLLNAPETHWTKLTPSSLLAPPTAVQQLCCTSVRGCVSGDKRGFVVFDGVCAPECERHKSNRHNLRRASDPTAAALLPRVADSRKTNQEEQKCTSPGSSERKEVGVRGEGAGCNNTIKDCCISAGRRWRKITAQRRRRRNVPS